MDELNRMNRVGEKATQLYETHKRLAGLLARETLAREHSEQETLTNGKEVLQFTKPASKVINPRSPERQYEVNLLNANNLMKYHGGTLHDIAKKVATDDGVRLHITIPDNVVSIDFSNKNSQKK